MANPACQGNAKHPPKADARSALASSPSNLSTPGTGAAPSAGQVCSVIEATDLDSSTRRAVKCPTCRGPLSIDPDEGDIGFLRCDVDPKHLWTLHTALERQATT